MQFIDYVTIDVKAGDGGRGCVSFRREKYVPRGGPDGGDGGRGGHVVFQASSEMNTLLDFRYRRDYHAEHGQHGMGKKMHGRNGREMILPVPVGTVIRLRDTDEVLADLVRDRQQYIAARGGRGGLGNAQFATPTKQTPRHAQPGEPGEERSLVLELKLLADVGLIGLPNAGKSTLISVLSSARPKIADYPFTTLVPNLGVVKYGNHKSFVIADIPGIIEGAHRGTGLGLQFLRHVERTGVFLHLIDVSDLADENPVLQLQTVNSELSLYREDLLRKPQAVVATKIDAVTDGSRLDMLREYCKTNRIDLLEVSAVAGTGIRRLLGYLARMLEQREDGTNRR